MRLCNTGRSALAGVIACIVVAAIVIMTNGNSGLVFHSPDGSPIPFNKEQFVAALRPTVDSPPGTGAQIDAANGKTYQVRETLQQIEDKLK